MTCSDSSFISCISPRSSQRQPAELGPGCAPADRADQIGKLYLQTLLALSLRTPGMAAAVRRAQARNVRQGLPVWAGVTALNADALWPPSATRSPTEYVRAASTRTLALVFALTSFARAAHLGVIYRPAVFFLARW